MPEYAEWPTAGKIITLELTRCILVLSEAEMLKRGKAYKRAQAARRVHSDAR
ncbi:MAG: hypothetical protein KJ650_01395 [Firmicutes bacterium]|nr:hypothetical protein [Bacillota bacterium]MBV1727137.1 hypothetical protein [Desulforudis sp.]MBV1735685.1 hypothetical protein [Desulforudis sp.]